MRSQVTAVGAELLGATSVEHFSSADAAAFVWARDGIAGVFSTGQPDKAPPFLTEFLAAPR